MIPTTGQIGLGGGRERVTAAIQLASSRTGVDFRYLMNQARIESSFNPNARARTSSATGLYQFIDQTWLGTVKQHGASHGLGWAADAIQRGANGRFYVADPGTRQAILDLRRQPEAASAMAAEHAADNGRYLERRLGRPAEPVDLYLAHFLGAGGAARFLRAHDANPDGAAAGMLPAAARANRNVFFDRGGGARSFAEIRAHFAQRIGGSAPGPAQAPVRMAMASPADPMRRGTIDPSDPMRMAMTGSAEQLRMAAFGPVEPRSESETESFLAGPRDHRRLGLAPREARLAYLLLAQMGSIE